MNYLKNAKQFKIALSTGLALFAMFFGAGNMIFPLQLGVQSGQHIVVAMIAFIITGVGFPFLGLFAVSLYEGNYWKFFSVMGKPLSFLVVTFLISIICFTVAAPRTELVVYDTLTENIPTLLKYPHLFSLLYFTIVFFIVFRPSRVIDIIGWFLSPIKITTFVILIMACVHFGSPLLQIDHSTVDVFKNGIVTGYGTMDLLAAIFFGTVAYKNILNKCSEDKFAVAHIIRVTIFSCCISAVLISVIYAGLILSSGFHAAVLQHTPTSALVGKIASVVMGEYGFIFVAICVSFACIATASALAEVGSDFLFHTIFQRKMPKLICLIATLVSMYAASTFGFDRIMAFAIPILTVLYPALIVLCVVNIVRKFNMTT
jgi:LIVCS family branched-chain amino acid:cation transporter